MTPQEIYEARKLARLNELSLKYTGRPYSAPTKTRPPKLTKEQRKERKERALELLKRGGLTHGEIAKKLGVSRPLICVWAREAGIKSKNLRWTPQKRAEQSEKMSKLQALPQEHLERFVELYESGAHVEDIARELGISKPTAYLWGSKHADKSKRAHAKAQQKQTPHKTP